MNLQNTKKGIYRICFCLICFFSANEVLCQELKDVEQSSISVYLQTGTMVFLHTGTFNLEYTFARVSNERIKFNSRIGIGGIAVAFGEGGSGVLAGVTMLTGKRQHHFESGLGLFLLVDSLRDYEDVLTESPDLIPLPLLEIGYRYQPPNGGITFKTTIGTLGLGVGLGYNF
ncbi:MAG: hypothetical protein R8G66_04805 [Cytophagales bacterium]|nr:hypothetical protein [Cytophagales bacterium]